MLSAGRAPAHVLMTSDTVGGVWTYALDLARGLAAGSTQVTLALLGPPPGEAQMLQAAGIPGLHLIATGLPLDWDMAVDRAVLSDAGTVLARTAGALQADLVHLNSPILASEAAFPVPLVGGCHSCLATWWQAVKGVEPLPPDFAWRRGLLERGYRNCQALIAPSRAFADATAAAYGIAPPSVVHNGRVPADRAEALAVEIFTAGRLWDEGKDLATLDRAAALSGLTIHAAGPTASPHGQALEFGHLHLLGTLDSGRVARHLAARPIFVSTALYEPFGLAVLEAAQAGCPLVLSDIPSFRELWDAAALFVPPRDEQGFAGTLQALATDPARRAQAGAAAAARAGRYGVERMVRETLEVYRQASRQAGERAVA